MIEITLTPALTRGARWLRAHAGMCIGLVAYLLVARLYVLYTPFFEVPGELWHFRRVQTSLSNALPPGLTFLYDLPPAPEADAQPPLYYALAALLVSPLDMSQEQALYRLNPYAAPGDMLNPTNRNVMVVSRAPLSEGPLSRAMLRLRWLSVACTGAALVLAYLLYLRLAGQRRLLALAALLALAFLPTYLFMGAGVGNHSLALLLLLAAWYLSLRLAQGHITNHLPWLAAIAAGLGGLVSWWGWAAAVPVAVALVTMPREHRATARQLVPPLLIALGPSLAWLAWRISAARPTQTLPLWQALTSAGLAERAWMAARAYWGLFGWLNVAPDAIYYTAAAVLAVFGISGLAIEALQGHWQRATATSAGWDRLREPGALVTALSVLGALAILGISLASPACASPSAAALPLASLVSLALVRGLRGWLQRRYAPLLLGLLTIAFLAVSVLAPVAYIAPAYAEPPRLDLDTLPYDMRPLDVALGDELFLLGYRADASGMVPGGILKLELYWLARKRMNTDYTAHVTVLGVDGALVASHMAYAGGGVHPTSLWTPGDVIVDRLEMRVAADAEAPTAADVRLSVYSNLGQEPLPAVDPHGNALGGNLRVTQVRLAAPVRVRYVPETPLYANLDNEVSLVGYGLSPALPVPGEEWKIILYWRSEGPLVHDYTVFIHLVDSHGEMVAQVDGPPVQGNYPTSFWEMGEHVRDVHYLPIPATLRADEYRLRVGLYRLETGERLVQWETDPPLDHIPIGPINVP